MHTIKEQKNRIIEGLHLNKGVCGTWLRNPRKDSHVLNCAAAKFCKCVSVTPRFAYLVFNGFTRKLLRMETLGLLRWDASEYDVHKLCVNMQSYSSLDPTKSLCPSRRWGRGEPRELAT